MRSTTVTRAASKQQVRTIDMAADSVPKLMMRRRE
jgi:hypothetical protein